MELQSAEDTIKEMKHQSNAAQIKFQEQLKARDNMHLQLDVIQISDSPEPLAEQRQSQQVVHEEAEQAETQKVEAEKVEEIDELG